MKLALSHDSHFRQFSAMDIAHGVVALCLISLLFHTGRSIHCDGCEAFSMTDSLCLCTQLPRDFHKIVITPRDFVRSPHDYRAHGLLHRWELRRACRR